MKIKYQPSLDEVIRKRKVEYAKIGIEAQIEALTEYEAGNPTKLRELKAKIAQIKKDNPKPEVE